MSLEKTVIGMDNFLPPVVYEEAPSLKSVLSRFDTFKATVCANNRIYGQFAVPISDICLTIPVSFSPSFPITNEYFTPNTLNFLDAHANILDLIDSDLLISSPLLYPFIQYTYGETISDTIKPVVRSENDYAFPSWLPPEHIYLQFILNCDEFYEFLNEGLISKTIKLDHKCLKFFESLLRFDLVYDFSFTNEFESSLLFFLLTPYNLHPFLSYKYEKGIIDSIKPVVDAENYYAYPAWEEIISTSLLVLMPLQFQFRFASVRNVLSSLSLLFKLHIIVPTDYLNIYLSLGLKPHIDFQSSFLFLLPLSIYPNLISVFDTFINYYLTVNTLSSFVRDLHVPLKLFLNHISSITSNIRFSQILSTASKVTLEGMLEDLVLMPLEDTYSSERITKGILTISTEAAFVPLIQMVYEYSLTAPLLFAPILTTVKRSKALVKYLTIDIKKFNISINIETIERE